MTTYDILIIGAGPAGLSAGIYAARAGKNVLILEDKAVGGQIITAWDVQNYPGIASISGADLAKTMKNQALNFGVKLKYERAMNIKPTKNGTYTIFTDGDEYQAKAIILATGAANRKLKLYNEEQLTGKGVSYCATCDGNFYKGKTVAVVGGGNTALEDAAYLAKLAKKVYLIHRRNEFRGDAANVTKVKSLKNVELILSANVKEILSSENENEKVTGLVVEQNTTEKELAVDAVFFAIGYIPNAKDFATIIELDNEGYIRTKDGIHTTAAHIYVAGDARQKDLKQLVTAAADGALAAATAVRELED